MNEKKCPTCDRVLPEDAPAGLCPVCVLTSARKDQAAASLPPLEEIRAAFPQFEILEGIGHGGMGVVYKVRQPHLNRLLALKILLPGLHADPGFPIRFAREAQVLAKLDHPNIVSVYDYGESSGFCWLTMEFVEGVNLRQAMQAARFTPDQALAVIPELCGALQYAHDQGVLHRDIKPENILIDASGRVKIVDFGIARLTGEDPARTVLTQTGAALGSTAYAAPEQIEQPHRVDHRADLYSLGVVFYEMLTGELPLGRFPAPSRKSSSPPRLDKVVFRTLEKSPADRYQSAEEMKRGVENAGEEPVRRRVSYRSVRTGSRALPPPLPGRQLPPKSNVGIWIGLLCLVLLIVFAGFAREALYALTGTVIGVGALLLTGMLIAVFPIFWHRMWVSRQLEVPVGPLVKLLGCWGPVMLMVVLLVHYHATGGGDWYRGKGGLFLQMLGVYLVIHIAAVPLLWLSSPKHRASGTGRAVRWVIPVALLAAISSLVFGKWQDGKWPLVNYFGRVNLSSLQSSFSPLNSAQALSSSREALASSLEQAQEAFDHRLIIESSSSSVPDVGILAGNFREWEVYARALLQHLSVTLPSGMAGKSELLSRLGDMAENGRVPITDLADPTISYASPRWSRSHVLAAVAFAAILSSWCAVRGRWVPLGVFLVGTVLMGVTPVWVTPGSRDAKLMTGPPPPLPEKKVVADFSSPDAAAQTIFDAAWAGDLETFQNGFSRKAAAGFATEQDWDRLMKEFSPGRTWVAVKVTEGVESESGIVIVVRGKRVARLGMVYEEGMWKLGDSKVTFSNSL